MIGLIKKDFFIIKANFKTMFIIFAIYIIMCIQGSFDISFVIPLIGIMLFITTFSYDDFNNWNSYVATLPNGRKNAVKAKFISSIFLIFILTILSFGISILTNYFKNTNIDLNMIFSSAMGTLLSVVIIISLLYPIMFKFGSTNGRIILFVAVFAITAIIGLIAHYMDTSWIVNTIKKLEDYLYVAIPVILIIMLTISYLISSKIYINKEF